MNEIMKKTYLVLLAFMLSFSTPSNSFFKVEHVHVVESKNSAIPIKRANKKKKNRFKQKNKNRQRTKINQNKKSWASMPLMIISFVFFAASVGLFLFAPLSITFVALLGVTVLCFLVFLIVSLAINSWGQERKAKKAITSEKINAPINKEEEVTSIDIVYLKNGSVIKCTILEQIVGETIKIETSDGSIFVYKMEEVLKITKEK